MLKTVLVVLYIVFEGRENTAYLLGKFYNCRSLKKLHSCYNCKVWYIDNNHKLWDMAT